MERKIITTADGSITIHLEEWNESYHSKHGAIKEAYHVFMKNGLFALEQKEIAILEMGFGTGLNALITYWEAQKRGLTVIYSGLEAFPIAKEEIVQLNYVEQLKEPHLEAFWKTMHLAPWEVPVTLAPFFTLKKEKKDFFDLADSQQFDLVYFDAFGPRVQPELWTIPLLEKVFRALRAGGLFVTYSAKGSVRRNLQEVGFTVERLPGPPGKREMLRALKA